MLQEALHKNPQNVEIALIIASIDSFLSPSKLTELAVKACEQALEIEPDNPDVLKSLSQLYEKLGQYEQSIEIAKHLVQIDPSYENWYWLAYVLIESGREEEAIQTVGELVVKNPSAEYLRLLAEVWGKIGDVYRRQKKRCDAITAYQRAIELAKALGWERQPTSKLAYWEHHLQELQAQEIDKTE